MASLTSQLAELSIRHGIYSKRVGYNASYHFQAKSYHLAIAEESVRDLAACGELVDHVVWQFETAERGSDKGTYKANSNYLQRMAQQQWGLPQQQGLLGSSQSSLENIRYTITDCRMDGDTFKSLLAPKKKELSWQEELQAEIDEWLKGVELA